MDRGQGQVVVWDPLVRLAHWALVVAFFVAYLTEGEPIAVHSWAGYTIAGIVVVRTLWGIFGPAHARFGSFLHSPRVALLYLRDLLRFRARRYLGHSPAGGAMSVALLLMLAATATTGMLALGDTKKAGPLAFLYPTSAAQASADEPLFPTLDGPAPAGTAGDTGAARRDPPPVQLHETVVNVTLLLVVLHVAGVALASFAHRENLIRSMITGRKRAE